MSHITCHRCMTPGTCCTRVVVAAACFWVQQDLGSDPSVPHELARAGPPGSSCYSCLATAQRLHWDRSRVRRCAHEHCPDDCDCCHSCHHYYRTQARCPSHRQGHPASRTDQYRSHLCDQHAPRMTHGGAGYLHLLSMGSHEELGSRCRRHGSRRESCLEICLHPDYVRVILVTPCRCDRCLHDCRGHVRQG